MALIIKEFFASVFASIFYMISSPLGAEGLEVALIPWSVRTPTTAVALAGVPTSQDYIK